MTQSPLTPDAARDIVDRALARWHLPDADAARRALAALQDGFADDVLPDSFREAAAQRRFRDFFVWGHDHDFGHGVTRPGAMETRHVEIAAGAIQSGVLPPDLTGRTVLDVGCWSGGDALVLAGLGAAVSATEEHPRSAASAVRLMELVNCPVHVRRTSLFQDDPSWRQGFDIVYCSGVLYHVTDPLLLLRICFCYLRPGGRLIVETKAETERQDSVCQYSGTSVAGWNFFAPSRQALARWLADAGFPPTDILINTRPVGRFLACAVKRDAAALPETAGFSRPGSWLEGAH